MTKLEQAARQALEFLESGDFVYPTKLATALREALDHFRDATKKVVEQAEQGPVGVVEGSGEWGIAGVLVAGIPIGTKLYAAPVRTKDLTDDEIYPLYNEPSCDREAIEFARAVIAADREKNK